MNGTPSTFSVLSPPLLDIAAMRRERDAWRAGVFTTLAIILALGGMLMVEERKHDETKAACHCMDSTTLEVSR